MTKYIMLYFFSVFISSVSQILLKMSSKKEYDNLIQEYVNIRVFFAYMIFFISSLLTVFAYRYVPLSMGMVLESSGYVFVTILSWLFLHERIHKKGIIGILCILLGTAIAFL